MAPRGVQLMPVYMYVYMIVPLSHYKNSGIKVISSSLLYMVTKSKKYPPTSEGLSQKQLES